MGKQVMGSSRFFTDLPAELRTEIYTYAYTTSRLLPKAWESETCSRRPDHKSRYRGVDGLLVCKQWFAESYDIALHNGTWETNDWVLLLRWIKKLVKRDESSSEKNTSPALGGGHLQIPHAMTALRIELPLPGTSHDTRVWHGTPTIQGFVQSSQPFLAHFHHLTRFELGFASCLLHHDCHNVERICQPQVVNKANYEKSRDRWAQSRGTLVLVGLLTAFPALRDVVIDARVWCGLERARSVYFEMFVTNAINFGSALAFHLGHKGIKFKVLVNKFGGISEKMAEAMENTDVEVERCLEARVCKLILHSSPAWYPWQSRYW